MGIEEQIDRLIDLGEDIKSRLDRLVELASDHFVGAGKMVAEEPPKRWRRLILGDCVQRGDWMHAKVNCQVQCPPGGDWIPADPFYFGKIASGISSMYFARPVAEEPAKKQPPKPSDPEYREPVLPQDGGKWCEFSNDGKGWIHGKLRGYAGHLWQSVAISEIGAKHWVHARIKKDA